MVGNLFVKDITQGIKSSRGFTLAEVLITLGIIGIVAAMTIPTLIANISGMQYRSKFKKTISTLSQAGRMSNAQYGFDYADASGHVNDECTANDKPDEVKNICSLFNGSLTGFTFYGSRFENFKEQTKWEVNFISDISDFYDEPGETDLFALSDGTLISLELSDNCDKSLYAIESESSERYHFSCFGILDVNGPSKPNQEVACENEKDTKIAYKGVEPCVVKKVTDVFPVYFYNDTVIPATNAAKYVLSTAK